jgi:L-glyceraldehyde 3-phosphate reductase
MFNADESRYSNMKYNRCGISGLKLPAISLGLWHNFGNGDVFETGRSVILEAFNSGITHFDLANNYGPPAGSAEENFGRVLKKDLHSYRDEIIVSTKAGYEMWDGPYGNYGSKKYLISSLDQSLKRMNLDYVDIFYHHRPDPETPLEETMGALELIVRQGKALYVGISNYNPEQTQKASRILKSMNVHCLIHQPKYSMLERTIEKTGLLDTVEKEGIGMIVFSPLAQGLLTDRYLNGIPTDSRAAKEKFLKSKDISEQLLSKIRALNSIASKRNQTLAEMAIAWILRDKRITSVLVGASSVRQLKDNVSAIQNLSFDKDELTQIEKVLGD